MRIAPSAFADHRGTCYAAWVTHERRFDCTEMAARGGVCPEDRREVQGVIGYFLVINMTEKFTQSLVDYARGKAYLIVSVKIPGIGGKIA